MCKPKLTLNMISSQSPAFKSSPVGWLGPKGHIQVLLCLYVVLCHHIGLCSSEKSLHIVRILLQHLQCHYPSDLLSVADYLLYIQCAQQSITCYLQGNRTSHVTWSLMHFTLGAFHSDFSASCVTHPEFANEQAAAY